MSQEPLPVGERLGRLPSGARPAAMVQDGRLVRLEPVQAAAHAMDLYRASHGDPMTERLWTYMAVGPFADLAAHLAWLEAQEGKLDPLLSVVIDKASGRAVGQAALMRIEPAMGVIEVGNIWYAPTCQRTALPTEVMWLLFRHVFERLGYRRLEWKCDSLNAPSRRAALRFGFTFEGIFRQHMVIKGRNRDTAWFAMLDSDWPRVGAGMARWLDPANFDELGRQRSSLADCLAAAPP